MAFLQHADRYIPIGAEPLRIGRAPDQDIILLDEGQSVSRVHARVFYDRGDWRVEDLGSRNGTRVNGLAFRSQRSAALRHGDVISVGQHRLTFVMDAPAHADPILGEVRPPTLLARARYLSTEGFGARLPPWHLCLSLGGVVQALPDLQLAIERLLGCVQATFRPRRAFVGIGPTPLGDWIASASLTHHGAVREPFFQPSWVVDKALREGRAFLTSNAALASRDEHPEEVRHTLVAPILNMGQTYGLLYVEEQGGPPPWGAADLETLTALGLFTGQVAGPLLQHATRAAASPPLSEESDEVFPPVPALKDMSS